ncbi:MAG: MBL fold metallo-hydrolase [Candidatus Zixiibacteriota bacterium]|nr:MAG: MBL fold metallo-hydrolase [candidate division Zixibacteria bacterium]
MKRTVLVFLVLIGLGSAAGGTGDEPDRTPIEISRFSDHLYVITCTGGEEFGMPPYRTNLIASVGDDGILLVDAAFAATGPALADTLKTLGNGQLRMVINTHYHGDHTSGNRFLSDRAVTIAHRNAIGQLSGRYFHLPELPSPNRPSVGFDDSLVVYFNGEEIHIVHTPNSHSAGDAYVYFVGSGVVAAGDLFFSDEIPYIDQRDNGTVLGYIDRIRAFIDEFPDEVVFLAAHGRRYSKDDLREYRRMLTETTDLVRGAAAAGQTEEEMIENDLLAAWQSWNGQFPTTTLEAWIRTVYRDVSGRPEAKTSVCEPLTEVLGSGAAALAVAKYRELKSSQPDAYDYGEAHLNMLGYQLLFRNRLDDALKIFKFNAETFPASFNVYDSYGEALLLSGDTAQSIVNYEKSLELNPDNANAVNVLKGLRDSR